MEPPPNLYAPGNHSKLITIPKVGVAEFFGEIPEGITLYEQIQYAYDDSGMDHLLYYFDVLQHECWKVLAMHPKEIERKLSSMLKRADWVPDNEIMNWESDKKEYLHEAWLMMDESMSEIREFTFEIDLRQPGFHIMQQMIELARKYDLMLMDLHGIILEPEMSVLLSMLDR